MTDEQKEDYLNNLYSRNSDWFGAMTFLFSSALLFFILNLRHSTPIFISANFLIFSILSNISSFHLAKMAINFFTDGEHSKSKKLNNLSRRSSAFAYFSMAIGIFVFMAFGYKW